MMKRESRIERKRKILAVIITTLIHCILIGGLMMQPTLSDQEVSPSSELLVHEESRTS